jgi:transposase
MAKSPREKAIEALKEMSDKDFQQQREKLEEETEEEVSNYIDSLTWSEKSKEEIREEHDWSAINESMENEGRLFRQLLADLVTYIEPPDNSGKGRNGIDFRDMLFSICLKEYLGKSYRSINDELEMAKRDGYISEVCCFSTYSNYKKKEEVQEAFQELITLAGTPLEGVEDIYAVDATGFSDTRFGKWQDYKYDDPRHGDEHRLWKKLHICVGTKTNIVTAATVTKGTKHDSTQFDDLLEITDRYYTGDSVVADKAYMARDNYDKARELDMKAHIPFQDNATKKARGSFEWSRMYHMFHNKKGRFKNTYHKRSNVETTMNSIKQRFGKNLSCRDKKSLETELLAKVLCYNICTVIRAMYKLDVSPTYP